LPEFTVLHRQDDLGLIGALDKPHVGFVFAERLAQILDGIAVAFDGSVKPFVAPADLTKTLTG
jgi:hypothetical protein